MESKEKTSQKKILTILAVIAILLLAGMVTGIVFLSGSGAEVSGQVRDIFIIILALESFLIGAAMIVLIVQLALLSNLLQNEIKPILASTKDTVQTVKGTSKFISEKAVSPIVTIGGLLAGGRKLFEIIGFIRENKEKE